MSPMEGGNEWIRGTVVVVVAVVVVYLFNARLLDRPLNVFTALRNFLQVLQLPTFEATKLLLISTG